MKTLNQIQSEMSSLEKLVEQTKNNPLEKENWVALGKALGWGQWTKTLAEVEHDWELKHYLPDTAKTPVYECRKCSVLKENNVITIENEYEWVEVDKASYTHSYIVKQHGGRYLEGWKFQALKYFDLVLTGGDTEKFWLDLLNPNRE